MKKFKRVLVANRGEIAIRVFRACHELGIRTVAVYSKEDQNSLFRTKADESYLIGKNKGPIEAYLDIDEIVKLAIKKGVDAIHPGYGFLSENPDFAKKCAEAGIEFIGPTPEMMISVGDKIKSKIVATAAGVPIIPGVERPIANDKEAKAFAKEAGYPIMLKAASGGGGRGMRIVRDERHIIKEFHAASSEALKAFGNDDIFIEKYLEAPKHIEVQILGDKHGNVVHLYERDCSIQRRHQKVVEFTPSLCLTDEQRKAICDDAIKIAKAVNYRGAGTCEFLVDQTGAHYFIEMNPRIQVEHTVTEMVTGIDLVQSQILVAEGYALDSQEINLSSQEAVHVNGYSIQCRVTTEDPKHDFMPDTGKIDVYRTGSGFGVRLDGGNGFTGAVISPYYDSLLVKCTTWSRSFEDAIRKSVRAIKEIKISGVKTNTDFLINVLNHETFHKGLCDTNFIADNKSLMDFKSKTDKELRVLNFIGEKVVNETKGRKQEFDIPHVPNIEGMARGFGTKQILDQKGAKGVVDWVRGQNRLLLTDTTMRDAHQSLMATRMRTVDMKKIAKATAVLAPELFSLEMWGGATFDVAYRFLKENPWDRLDSIRERVPNVLLQMLIRGSNGVGYKNYPDNVIKALIDEAAMRGIDVFRIFDSLNWLEGMKVSMDQVLQTGKIAEGTLCYTGDILDERRDKYNLDYYVKMAKEVEKMGAHILGIKDMSGLLKPYAAKKLITALKNEISIPIHLHTHDTTGNGVATLLIAAEAGVDIVDTAFNSMSGLTSQPALNSIVAALSNSSRDTGLKLDHIQQISDYWTNVRPVYQSFESDLKTSSAEIYKYEIPGGQYSNLKPQVDSFGLSHKFGEVKEMYKSVNDMFGDIIKVTPSSKAVGDMAIFMVQNELTPENIIEKGKDLAFPDSVVSYFAGYMGQPQGGFPEPLQKIVLKNQEPVTCRPGDLLPPEDFGAIDSHLRNKYNIKPSKSDLISYALYPKVVDDYYEYLEKHGDFSRMGSDIFFHGLVEGETCEIEIEAGKILNVKLLEIGKILEDGTRAIIYEVNGNRREVSIKDESSSLRSNLAQTVFADDTNPCEIGSPIPGKVTKVLVSEGDEISENDILFIIEAMKMETTISAKQGGVVEKIYVEQDQLVKSGELLLEVCIG